MTATTPRIAAALPPLQRSLRIPRVLLPAAGDQLIDWAKEEHRYLHSRRMRQELPTKEEMREIKRRCIEAEPE